MRPKATIALMCVLGFLFVASQGSVNAFVTEPEIISASRNLMVGLPHSDDRAAFEIEDSVLTLEDESEDDESADSLIEDIDIADSLEEGDVDLSPEMLEFSYPNIKKLRG